MDSEYRTCRFFFLRPQAWLQTEAHVPVCFLDVHIGWLLVSRSPRSCIRRQSLKSITVIQRRVIEVGVELITICHCHTSVLLFLWDLFCWWQNITKWDEKLKHVRVSKPLAASQKAWSFCRLLNYSDSFNSILHSGFLSFYWTFSCAAGMTFLYSFVFKGFFSPRFYVDMFLTASCSMLDILYWAC